jgi:hypothetical protein
MGIQVVGGVSGALADVDAGTKALKTRVHPMDVLGSYQLEAISGTMAAGLAGASPIFACRWGDATRFMLLRRLAFDARALTAFTAGAFLFDFIVARGWTGNYTGGTSILPTGNSQKRRTSFGTTLITDLRISSTATLTAGGTPTLDGLAMMNVRGHIPGTATGYPIVSAAGGLVPGAATSAYATVPFDLFSPSWSGEWPLVLAQNEGFILRATVPATGTWDFSVTMEWSEVTAF